MHLNASSTCSNPAPHLSGSQLRGSAVSIRHPITSSLLQAGHALHIIVAAPATCGAAILVPLFGKLLVPLFPGYEDIMSTPGAAKST